MRLSELTFMTLDDVDFDQGGGLTSSARWTASACVFGDKTALPSGATAASATAPPSAAPQLWVGPRPADPQRGHARWRLGQNEAAGNVHPHQPRHTFAHQWLATAARRDSCACRWRSRTMLSRYAASTADDGPGRPTASGPLGTGCRARSVRPHLYKG